MVSTFTPNVQLEEPARGDYVGTWDTPVNSNATLIDLILGGRTTISLNNSPVVLAAAQYECKTITFNSTLTGNVAITFPTSFTKPYTIRNTCTGSSAFVITLQTTAAGGQIVCAPPGEAVDIVNDGTNLYYSNLGHIGGYWDYGGSSVPLWVTTCTVPPYLACTGGTFSSATYPTLAVVLGSTTLPDTRGRSRVALDAGAARLSSAVAGFSPNTVGAGGGSENPQQHTHTIAIVDPGHFHGAAASEGGAYVNVARVGNLLNGSVTTSGGIIGLQSDGINAYISKATTSITATASNSGTGTAGNLPPAYIGGITMIRAG